MRWSLGMLLAVMTNLLVMTAGVLAQPPASDAGGLPLQTTRNVVFDTDEGTWVSIDLSPDGRTLVFDLLGDLYALDAQGGKARPIARGPAFEGQPAISPDGTSIAYTSDRSGSENVWVAQLDGSGAHQLTDNHGPNEYVSPAWSADGKSIYASLYRADRNAIELWRYDLGAGGQGRELTQSRFSALGAKPSPDGRFVYFAAHDGPVFEDDVTLPLWSIRRLDLKSGIAETMIGGQGGAMRPVLSADGRWLAYASRVAGQTELRLRDLSSGADRQIAFPIQRD